jgi:CSLREA domain-containing protein
MMRNLMRVVALVGAIGLAAIALTACQSPNSLQVTSMTDAPDRAVGDDVCASAAGECTLRAAVQEANARSGGARIELGSAQRYVLGVAGTGEDAAATGDLDITNKVDIEGHGSTIDGGQIDRVLHVTTAGSLSIHGVTITGGLADFGGGVRIDAGGSASVSASSISGNEANGATRCYVVQGLTWGNDCSDEKRSVIPGLIDPQPGPSQGGGGGIWSRGTLSVWDSAIDTNLVSGRRGCVPLSPGKGTVCSMSRGGGVLNYGTAGFVNVTISSNHTIAAGGAGLVDAASGHSTLLFTTVADNTQDGQSVGLTAWPDSDRAVGWGPPTDSYYSYATGVVSSYAGLGTTLVGSVVDGVCAGGIFQDTSTIQSNGDSLVTDASCLPAPTATDQVGVAAALGLLADNGGPSRTQLPLAGSPLVDAIAASSPTCAGAVHADQRGAPRDPGSPCTVGSVEVTAGG